MARPHTYKLQIGEKQISLVIDGDKILSEGSKNPFIVDQLSDNTYAIILEGKPYKVFVESVDNNRCTVTINGIQQQVIVKNERDQLLDLYGVSDSRQLMDREVRAPMPGLVLDILVSEQQEISAGSGLLVLEAMKMENEIKASSNGAVARIHVNPGDAVAKGDLLMELDVSDTALPS